MAEQLVVQTENWVPPLATSFRPGLYAEIMSSLFRLERKQKICLRIRIFLFSSCYSFGIETINTFVHSVVPLKTIPDSRPKWESLYPFSDPNSIPFEAAQTYMFYIRK